MGELFDGPKAELALSALSNGMSIAVGRDGLRGFSAPGSSRPGPDAAAALPGGVHPLSPGTPLARRARAKAVASLPAVSGEIAGEA